jgi:hypothetical protein
VSNFDFTSVPESAIASANKRTKLKKKRRTKQRGAIFYFWAALILQQKSAFSLNDSHAFNRAKHANRQHWQYNPRSRWNLREKASITSLDLPRLHMAFIFVLCASVAVEVTRLSAFTLPIEFRSDALGCALLLYEDPLSP